MASGEDHEAAYRRIARTKMEMDLAYIDNWSLALDLALMVRTIPVVLTGKGAS